MSNTFYTPEQVAAVAAELVEAGVQLLPTASVAKPGDWQPGGGNSVLVRVPAAAIAEDRALNDVTSEVTMVSLEEDTFPVSLSTHAVSGVALSEADNSLNLRDMASQVIAPQSDAVVDFLEAMVADVLAGVTAETGTAFDASAPEKTFTAIRRVLRGRGVKFDNDEPVYAIAGGNVIDALLDSGALDFSKTGDADALRSGSVGRVRGFHVLESSRIGDDEIVAYPRHGLTVALKPPAVPEGAPHGAVVESKNGNVALRWVRSFDPLHTADYSVLSTFAGCKITPAYEVTRDYDAGTVTRSEVAGGHVVKVDTAAGA